MADWIQQFETIDEGFFTTTYYDEAYEREFTKTPESIVRLSRVGGEWSVSEHSPDFFDEMGEPIYNGPTRFKDEEDAREYADELIEARC